MTKFAPLFTWRSAIVESGLPATTKLVALALSLHMNERGGSCYPSAARLAREISLNVSTVREHRAYLELGGWLVCVERGGVKGETRRASAYEARIPDPSSWPTHRPARPVGETALTPRPERPDPSSWPTPGLQEVTKRSTGRRRPKTPLPEEWTPTEATRQWARTEYPEHATRSVLAAFKDHAAAIDRRQVDWDRAFRNWIRNEAKYHPAEQQRGPTRTYL